MKKKVFDNNIIKIVVIIVGLCIIFALLYGILFGKHTYNDIGNYNEYIGEDSQKKYSSKWGMDETIFPEQILDTMQVNEFSFTYHNPWDAEYVGYLTVTYSQDEYTKEIERLSTKENDTYTGLFGVTGEPIGYSVLAMDSDSVWGFIYALDDSSKENTITYVEVVFPGRLHMNLDKVLPKEYQLENMNVWKKQ